jgi:hypothetical protein
LRINEVANGQVFHFYNLEEKEMPSLQDEEKERTTEKPKKLLDEFFVLVLETRRAERIRRNVRNSPSPLSKIFGTFLMFYLNLEKINVKPEIEVGIS